MKRMKNIKNEAGIGILEVLLSIVVLSLIAVALGSSTMTTALHTYKLTQARTAASNLCMDKVEMLASINPQSMDNTSHDATESSVTATGFSNTTFTRTTDVVVNADDSRTVTVNVTSNNSSWPASTEFVSTFTRW